MRPFHLTAVDCDYASRDEVVEVRDDETLLVRSKIGDVEADGAHSLAERLLATSVGGLLLGDESPQLGSVRRVECGPSLHAASRVRRCDRISPGTQVFNCPTRGCEILLRIGDVERVARASAWAR